MKPPQFFAGVGLKRRLPREHVVKHQAQRIEVTSDRYFATFQLFRGHVRGRAGADILITRRKIGREAGESEVGDADGAAPVNHHVVRLEVAVEHPFVVGGGQSHTKLPRNLDGLVLGKAPDLSNQSGQILAVNVLHGEEVLALNFPDVIDPADVGMRNLAGHADLIVEALEPARMIGQIPRQKLQGHRLAEFQIVGSVDFAHAAFAQQSDDAIAFGQHRARSEPGMVDGVGRRSPGWR